MLAINKLYDDAMKIASDNKINANNSWQLSLIDYFYDLTVLKEGDSINFQKASCTLDGCVKIYASRVDSVDIDTKKLMNGLVDSVLDLQEEQEDQEPIKKQSKRSKNSNTIETNLDSINLKKIDSEFLVDPLFKKTSADFDKGGACGLLLNHLAIGDQGRIIFDASEILPSLDSHSKSFDSFIDPGLLSQFDFSDIDQLYVCPSLREFQFNAENASFDPQVYMENVKELFNQQYEQLIENVVEIESKRDTHFGDFDNDDGGFNDDEYDQTILPIQAQVDLSNHIPLILNQMKKRYSLSPSEMANGSEEWVQDETGPSLELFSYFDKAMMKQWSGPESWKPKPITKETSITLLSHSKKKTKPTLNFFDPLPDNLFQKPKSLASLDLTKNNIKNPNVLSVDMMMTSKDFISLFSKPQTSLKFIKKRVFVNDSEPVKGEHCDAAFWAENVVQGNLFLLFVNGNTEEKGENNVEFGSNGFDNDLGDEGFGDESNNISDNEQVNLFYIHYQVENPSQSIDNWGSQLVQEPKKTNYNPLSYARVSKKVDIKLLKDSLWGTLNQQQDSTLFTKVIHDLSDSYPKNEWKDVSVAFCFICLLHLANENEFEISGSKDEQVFTDLTIQK